MKNWLITLGVFLIFISFACKKKLDSSADADPTKIYFLISQPSLASATFLIKCTNYDIILDTVFFTTPELFQYYLSFGGDSLLKNEEFNAGGFEPAEGLWRLRFKGTIQNQTTTFDALFLFQMNIEDDEE